MNDVAPARPSLKERCKPGPFVWLAPLALIIDQASKIWVELNFTYQSIVPFVPFVSLYRTWNEGIAFSMLEGLGEWGLVAIALAVLVFVTLLWQATEPDRKLSRLGFALVWGGAVGNIIDRAYHGHVVDFILVHTQNWSFAIFNLADSFISVGAACVVLDEFLHWRKAKKANT